MQQVSRIFYKKIIPYSIYFATFIKEVQHLFDIQQNKPWFALEKGRLRHKSPYYAIQTTENLSEEQDEEGSMCEQLGGGNVVRLGSGVKLDYKGSLVLYCRGSILL
jgi:hypothetical protein